jgi:hypothetical protein
MSDLFSDGKPSKCIFSDCCKFVVDLRRSADNPFEHLNDTEFTVMVSEIVTASRIIRQNSDLLDSLEHSEISELTRALYSLSELAKETKRHE